MHVFEIYRLWGSYNDNYLCERARQSAMGRGCNYNIAVNYISEVEMIQLQAVQGGLC